MYDLARPLLTSLACFSLIAAALALPSSAVALSCSATTYGATANDLSDDTTALQTALNASCGAVDLPAGVFRISGTLTVPSGGGIVGSGVLYQTADVTSILNANTSSGNAGITLSGFSLQKVFVNNSVADGIRIERSTDVEISGVEITGISARSGIELLLCDGFEVTDNYLHDFSATATGNLSDGEPISIDSIYIRSTDNGIVSGNVIDDMGGGALLQSDGVFVSNATNVHVTLNEISNVGEGVDLGASEDVLVDYNTIVDASAFGVKVMNGATESTIAYNTITRPRMSGVIVAGGPSTLINGATADTIVDRNVITDVGAGGTSGHPFPGAARAGVFVNGNHPDWEPVLRTAITDNTITDSQSTHTMQFGILIDEYAEDTTAVDNTISGHTVEGFRDLS